MVTCNTNPNFSAGRRCGSCATCHAWRSLSCQKTRCVICSLTPAVSWMIRPWARWTVRTLLVTVMGKTPPLAVHDSGRGSLSKILSFLPTPLPFSLSLCLLWQSTIQVGAAWAKNYLSRLPPPPPPLAVHDSGRGSMSKKLSFPPTPPPPLCLLWQSTIQVGAAWAKNYLSHLPPPPPPSLPHLAVHDSGRGSMSKKLSFLPTPPPPLSASFGSPRFR